MRILSVLIKCSTTGRVAILKPSHKVPIPTSFKFLTNQSEHFHIKCPAKLQMVGHVNANLQRSQQKRKYASKSFMDRGQKIDGMVRGVMV